MISQTDLLLSGAAGFEESIRYCFINRQLLLESLIHRSFKAEQGKDFFLDNEKLEFLGDAVLDLALSAILYVRFPKMREGDLTKMRAALVNEGHLAEMARGLGLGKYVLLGKGEDASGGREKNSILSSTYEAVLGAVFLDGGYEAVEKMIAAHFEPWLNEDKSGLMFIDFKSTLQELSQERLGETPVYFLEDAKGPDHEKTFTASVRVRGEILAKGEAKSKKEAEQKAAEKALECFNAGAQNPKGGAA